MYKDEKFWDRIASKFDRIEKKDISYKIFIEMARKYIKASDTILDFGCGTGLICNEIAENVGIIHAIDISTKMIEISKIKASEREIRNIDFARTTIFDEKFKENSFDAIIAFNIFHLLEERQKYFRRINSLLKPGGLLLSSTPCMREAPFLNYMLKFFAFIGVTPKICSFTGLEMENLLVQEWFETLEFRRVKPTSPQYLCVSKKAKGLINCS